MRVPRIHTPQAIVPHAELALDDRAGRYVTQVLRLQRGQQLVLFNGDGLDYPAELSHCDRRQCVARILDDGHAEPATRLPIHLGIGISRGERMDLAIQKSVELGVTAITPLLTRRSVVRLEPARMEKRLAHWRGVLISACEQSGRSRLPALHPTEDLVRWVVDHPGGVLLHHESTDTLGRIPPPDGPIALLVGPEGGLDAGERELALAAGFRSIRLGPRVLRTETAPLAALAAMQTLWGDFR